jgi:hypothetical protein
MSRKKTKAEGGRRKAKTPGPYVVDPLLVNGDDGKAILAFQISGPRFPGFPMCGEQGGESLHRLATRMNLAFKAGLEIGRGEGRNWVGTRARKMGVRQAQVITKAAAIAKGMGASLAPQTAAGAAIAQRLGAEVLGDVVLGDVAMKNRKKVRG